MRRIEDLPTKNDKPNEPVVIASAGVLSEDELANEEDERKRAQASSGGDDIWEVGKSQIIRQLAMSDFL